MHCTLHKLKSLQISCFLVIFYSRVIWYNEDSVQSVHSLYGYDLFTAHKLNWTEHSSVNGRIGIHVLRTNRALTALVSLQPISTKCSCEADVRDQWTRRVTGSTCLDQIRSVYFSSSAANKPLYLSLENRFTGSLIQNRVEPRKLEKSMKKNFLTTKTAGPGQKKR